MLEVPVVVRDDGRRLPASLAAALDPALHCVQRLPPDDDPQRWRLHRFGAHERLCAQPLTLTPYASARPCSARCRFCSENLVPATQGPRASMLRPAADYFGGLARALAVLRGLPLSLSLSGLENSDDADWLLQLLATLAAAERNGLHVEQRVLYSNGAGFALPRGDELLAALRGFRLSWLELSRHHHDAARNQAIMRFRDDQPVASHDRFAGAARRIAAAVPLKQVCIVQRGGVDDVDGVRDYLAFARDCGASTVIFREFSQLDAHYRDNGTRRYIDGARVDVAELLAQCLRTPALQLQPVQSTHGYYFWNVALRDRHGLDVVFEASDYAQMHARHATGRVYKLVYFPNGELCAGWEPGRDVVWRAA